MGVCPGGYTPPVNRITDRCKNISFPQLRMRTVIKDMGHKEVYYHVFFFDGKG